MNIFLLNYKDRKVNAVQRGKTPLIQGSIRNTEMHSVGRKQTFSFQAPGTHCNHSFKSVIQPGLKSQQRVTPYTFIILNFYS